MKPELSVKLSGEDGGKDRHFKVGFSQAYIALFKKYFFFELLLHGKCLVIKQLNCYKYPYLSEAISLCDLFIL